MAVTYKTVLTFLTFFLSVISFALYRVCGALIGILNFIISMLVSGNDQRQSTETAQVGHILWRKRFSTVQQISALDFLCLFTTHVEPEYILRPTVSLYVITNKEAIFVETPENLKIYSSDVYPLFFAAQFVSATKVIKMSIRNFVCLADQIGDPTVPVICMSNTGRYDELSYVRFSSLCRGRW